MVELVVTIKRVRKTRIWVCMDCFLPEALEHPTLVQALRSGADYQKRIQKRRERTRMAREASRFKKTPASSPEKSGQQNDFVREEEAPKLDPGSFIRVNTVHGRLGIPEGGASKLMSQMGIEPIEHHGEPCIKQADLEQMESEVRKRMAKKNRSKKDDKYKDQIEAEEA